MLYAHIRNTHAHMHALAHIRNTHVTHTHAHTCFAHTYVTHVHMHALAHIRNTHAHIHTLCTHT